jgi:hypothetical protein
MKKGIRPSPQVLITVTTATATGIPRSDGDWRWNDGRDRREVRPGRVPPRGVVNHHGRLDQDL